MKHITSYKLFESEDGLIITLKDICLDLEDDGFTVDIKRGSVSSEFDTSYPLRTPSGRLVPSISVTIFKKSESSSHVNGKSRFAYSLISNVVNRIDNYMSQQGWKRRPDSQSANLSNGMYVRNLTAIYIEDKSKSK